MQRNLCILLGRCAVPIAAPLWLLLAAPSVCSAAAGDVLAGPVPAVVEEVIDGDTLRVRARIWLGQEVATLVRFAGVDAPEIHGACARERDLARRAQDFVARQVTSDGTGRPSVRLRDVRYGKFARRVVARVETAAGVDLAAALLAAGLARPYDGGARPGWCD